MRQLRAPVFLCALGAVSMGIALQINDGRFQPAALALATLASALAVWAALLRDRTAPPLPAEVVLGLGFLQGLGCHLLGTPAISRNPQGLQGFRGLSLLALLAGSAYLCLHLRASLQKARFLAVLACFAAMGAAVIRLSPAPGAEGWPFQRYLGLAALTAAGWAIGRLGGGVTGELAALFLLFQGRGFFVLERAWTETLVLAAFALAALLIAAPPRRLLPWVGGGRAADARAASMPSLPLPAVPVAPAMPRAQRPRAGLARAVTSAAAAWLVFALLNRQPFHGDEFLGTGLLCVAVAAHSRARATA